MAAHRKTSRNHVNFDRRTLAVTVRSITIYLLVLTPLLPVNARAACDQFAGNLISKQLRPQIASIDCAVLKQAGIDKKDHKLVSVCYESTGPTSRIRIDTQLHCYGSSESVVSKLIGGKNAPSVSENVTVEAEARGSDCHLNDVKIQPSGELGKALAALFDANGKARKALEQGLAEACKK
jgi:hypothetical protein